tara:strand:- start:6 stop:560 length:555 start_codon:yes stop_codon:yes gene_type:complete
MNKQTLLIHNLTALYEILNELKFLINFNLKKINSNEIKEKKFNSSDLIISNDHNVTEKYLKLHDKPIELMKLIDMLNISFLKKKIEFQRDVKIGEYSINFNSRKIEKGKKNLTLTEKESKIINFLINSEAAVSINQLQKNVWGYKSKLETHTVETHVYRLRKKILKNFNDNNFIKSMKNGYKIN